MADDPFETFKRCAVEVLQVAPEQVTIEAKFADVQLTITRHRPPTSHGKGEADDE